jgi:hypothetical protein
MVTQRRYGLREQASTVIFWSGVINQVLIDFMQYVSLGCTLHTMYPHTSCELHEVAFTYKFSFSLHVENTSSLTNKSLGGFVSFSFVSQPIITTATAVFRIPKKRYPL